MRTGTLAMNLGIPLLLASCTDAVSLASTPGTTEFDDVSEEEWAALGSARVFFGHQSVGRDIVEGLKEVLAANPSIPVRIVTTDSPASVEGPAFIEASIGQNGDPLGKTAAFGRIVAEGAGEGGLAIALHKYCYVDMLPDTDVDALFAAYVDAMRTVKADHPGTTFVHVTMPLTTAPDSRAKQLVKRLVGREPDPDDPNLGRNRFNRLLLEEFGGREPVFDLARLESTTADGERVRYLHGSDTVFSLDPDWTYDGGHLNEEGRRRVARELLRFLATLAASPP